MKDVKVIKLTIKQLLITQVTIVAILTTCTQLKNVKEMRISEKVLNEENKLEIARAVNIETKLKTSGKQTQLLSKREGADSQVMTRSALTERQKNNENSKIAQQKEETIQEGEQETILQAVQQEYVVEEQQSIEIVQNNEYEEYIEVEQNENYKTIKEIKISKSMNLTERTGLSKEDFKLLISRVKQDKTKFFYNNSDYIYDICKEYQINEIFFCGLISAESGWEIVESHRNTHNYISLMSKGKLIRYSSVEEGLRVAAQKLHKNYLSEGGKYYNGKTLAAVKINFCPNSSKWINLVYSEVPIY